MLTHTIDKPAFRCIFTVVRNEPQLLPLWLSHHRSYFDHLYVLFHQSATPAEIALCQKYQAEYLIIHNQSSYCWKWITDTANRFAKFLHQSFEMVAYSDVDELLVDTNGELDKRLPSVMRCTGVSIHHHVNKEPPLKLSGPLSRQRSYHTTDIASSKPIIKTDPNIDWAMGFHHVTSGAEIPINPNLYLIHLHFADEMLMVQRHLHRGQFDNISELEKLNNFGGHNFVHDARAIRGMLIGWEKVTKRMTPEIAAAVDMIDLSMIGCI